MSQGYYFTFVHRILTTIISDSQTRAKKIEDDGSFFCKISRDVTKIMAKRGSEKKEAQPARNVRRKLVLSYLSTRPT